MPCPPPWQGSLLPRTQVSAQWPTSEKSALIHLSLSSTLSLSSSSSKHLSLTDGIHLFVEFCFTSPMGMQAPWGQGSPTSFTVVSLHAYKGAWCTMGAQWSCAGWMNNEISEILSLRVATEDRCCWGRGQDVSVQSGYLWRRMSLRRENEAHEGASGHWAVGMVRWGQGRSIRSEKDTERGEGGTQNQMSPVCSSQPHVMWQLQCPRSDSRTAIPSLPS